ncbi:lantibiotic dehydratase [Actinocorallia populi]|uniref:lantibiotic dehydratase n=1 Tax=Actinocorallia populi TaxID=2079200 RepID=UPI001E3D94C4|nr:lantibiotic dehydratase [Actinocorallia populi]
MILVRATTDPGGFDLPDLDPADHLALETDGRAWLIKTWEHPQIRSALSEASPDLAEALDRWTLSDDAATVRDVQRAILSLAGYLKRWQGRATPFGLFAGVTTARSGPTAVRFGTGHRSIARADAEWLTDVITRLDAHRLLRSRLTVVAVGTATVRDGRLIVPRRTATGERLPGPLRDATVRYTRPVQTALADSRTPIPFAQLEADLLHAYPTASREAICNVLHGLIDQGALITNLRPAMTVVDGLTHLITVLRQALGDEAGPGLDDVAELLAQLEHIGADIAAHNTGDATAADCAITTMAGVNVASRPCLAHDVRLDADVSIPAHVLAEAERAAGVLLRVVSQPFGTGAWLDYHTEFRHRYGPGALVPVTELVSEAGLGYPSGFLGSTKARPGWRMITERDVALLRLIERAHMDQAEEITLTDADVNALTFGDAAATVPPDRIELAFTLHATDTTAIDRGEYRLRVTGAPAVPTSMAGRFGHLLDDENRARLAVGYTDASSEALAVQLVFPPRRPRNENVTRTPAYLPHIVPIGDHPDSTAETMIGIEDLAVTADAEQMYLVQASTGRRITPRIPHALELTVQTPPLARFLAEVAGARTAAFSPFDVGAARNLVYIPRIHYQRTVLAPARWVLEAADLPELETWLRRWRVPARVVVNTGALRLPLDLGQPLDRALLTAQLKKTLRIELLEDAPPDGFGWSHGRPVEFLLPMRVAVPRPLPTTTPPGKTYPPGTGLVLAAQLAGDPARFDDILTGHLPVFFSGLDGLVDRWWTTRTRDLIRVEADHHLMVIVRLHDPDGWAPAAHAFGEFAKAMSRAGLPSRLTFTSCHEHPGRYGHDDALDAAERVFAADTIAAIAQLQAAQSSGIPPQALAAASMAHLAAAFAPDPVTGYRALLTRLPRGSGPIDRTLTAHVHRLADPTDGYQAVQDLSDGQALAEAWAARDIALTDYHRTVSKQREPNSVLRSLLHEHHRRAVIIDTEVERDTGRLARAAAMRRLALDGAVR